MAKFFMCLDFKYGDHWHPVSIYGPYEHRAATLEALSRLFPNEKKEQFIIFDGELLEGVPPSPLEKPEAEKRAPGNMKHYVKNDSGYTCRDCGERILAVRVAHPIWYKEFGTGGGGECHYSEAPYCPNCERKPSTSGEPIYV